VGVHVQNKSKFSAPGQAPYLGLQIIHGYRVHADPENVHP
jgi:hypothetical protein